MFAARLANRAGWIGSVDEFLDGFTPEEFDERYAAELVDGAAPEWVERLATILKRGFCVTAMAKIDPTELDPLAPDLRQPVTYGLPFGDVCDAPRPGEAVSPNQAAAMFAATFGVPTKGS